MTTPRATAERIALHADTRGSVFEPLRAGEFASQANAHVVVTEPGAVRGNHYHERGTEIAVAVGPAQVRVREGGQVRDLHVPAGEAWRFVFPPLVSHAFRNPGPAPMVLAAFNTVAHDPAAPDVVRDVLIEG